MSHDVRVRDVQSFEHDEQVLRLRGIVLESSRLAEPTRVVAENLVSPVEHRHLVIPNADVVGPAVNEHHGPAAAGDIIVDDCIADVERTCLRYNGPAN